MRHPVAAVTKKKGFTLIELLVVIAIIVILAAILFPVFARARENARRSSCQSQVKQLGLGMLQYVQDYDETYPPQYAGDFSGFWQSWETLLQPYIKSTQILNCPSRDVAVFACSYNYNNGLSRTGWVSGNNTPRSIATIQSSSTTWLFGELAQPSYCAQSRSGNDVYSITNGVTPTTYSSPNYYDLWFRVHLDGMNVGYTDGHVKWSKADNLNAINGNPAVG